MNPDSGMFIFTPIIQESPTWKKIMKKEVTNIIKKTRKKQKKRDLSIRRNISVYCPQDEWDKFKAATAAENSDIVTELSKLIRGYTLRRETFEDE